MERARKRYARKILLARLKRRENRRRKEMKQKKKKKKERKKGEKNAVVREERGILELLGQVFRAPDHSRSFQLAAFPASP